MSYPSIKEFSDENAMVWGGNNKGWVLQEKIDGSQLSFYVNDEGKLQFFNKGKEIQRKNRVFSKSVTMLENIVERFDAGLIYHGESVSTKTHNTAIYDRTPTYYFILYDVQYKESKEYMSHNDSTAEAHRIGLEHVPAVYCNDDETMAPAVKVYEIVSLMETGEVSSFLGGFCEGVVLKLHNFTDNNGKVFATKRKFVTNKFKERHSIKKPKKIGTTKLEFLEELGSMFAVEPRFFKSYQHLRDQDLLGGSNEEKLELICTELDIDFIKENKDLVMNYMWAEFLHIFLAKTKEDYSKWYNKHLSNPTQPDEEIIQTLEIQDMSPDEYLDALSLLYATPSRFFKVLEFITPELSGNRGKDATLLSHKLDDDIESNHMESIKNSLWDAFQPIILFNSKKNVQEWYETKIITLGE
jgi:hypothetical protein